MRAEETRRSGWLGTDNAVRITVHVDERSCYLEYLGATSDLVLAGCLTQSMIERRAAYHQGDSRGLRDEHGRYFNLHRAATRGIPSRMRLKLRDALSRAMELPGMRELFAEKLPVLPPPSDAPIEPVKPGTVVRLRLVGGTDVIPLESGVTSKGQKELPSAVDLLDKEVVPLATAASPVRFARASYDRLEAWQKKEIEWTLSGMIQAFEFSNSSGAD
jgi:hypothetical protein